MKQIPLLRITVVILMITTLFQSGVFAQPDTSRRPTANKFTRNTRAPVNKTNVPAQDPYKGLLQSAQVWLKNFGYDLTLEQVQAMKIFHATAGTIERAQALTTENMKHLRVLGSLETLELASMGNDNWIAHIEALTRLRSFTMGPANKLTDRSMDVFGKLTELRVLYINGCPLSDAGFAKLAGLTKLENLGINYAKITDASMPLLGRFSGLVNLNLNFTNVTDAGLPHLYQLQKLRYLTIQSRKITAGAVAVLRQHLPNCRVVY